MAPYCAIPRDYLSDTPLLRAMGFLVSQHGQLGAIPPPPFLSVSPLEYMRSRGAIPPSEKGYLSDTSAIPYENKANGCDTPLCDTISKGYCAIWGGISHWAAKFEGLSIESQSRRLSIIALWSTMRLIVASCFVLGMWYQHMVPFSRMYHNPSQRKGQNSRDSQTVLCKPCSENFGTKGWKRGGQSRSPRNSLKSPFSNHH